MVNNGYDQSQSWLNYPIVRGLILFEHILFRYINDGYDEYLYEDNGKSIQNMLLKDFLKRAQHSQGAEVWIILLYFLKRSTRAYLKMENRFDV